jgi:hypothetical protein
LDSRFGRDFKGAYNFTFKVNIVIYPSDGIEPIRDHGSSLLLFRKIKDGGHILKALFGQNMITALNEFFMNYKDLQEKWLFWIPAIINLAHFLFPTQNGLRARPIPEIPPAPLYQRGVGGDFRDSFPNRFCFRQN